MSTLAEIEKSIETLPGSEVETLVAWLEQRRAAARTVPPQPDKRAAVAAFLQRWSGAGEGMATDEALRDQRTARLIEKHVK